MDKLCVRCFVLGRVQGVSFRASTQKQAQMREVTGWVRNLPDGRVEVLIAGDKEKVLSLYEWLKEGPRLARVDDVTYEELPWQVHNQFEVI